MAESQQHKLDRVRSPRVQITYDVEVGGAIQQKELPFVVGVLADLSGKPSPDKPLPDLKERKFLEIDRDNFEKVMKGMEPRMATTVPNVLSKDGTRLAVELKFETMADFEPQNVAKQIKPLKELLEVRKRLSDLLARIDGNDAASSKLEAILGDHEALGQLRDEFKR